MLNVTERHNDTNPLSARIIQAGGKFCVINYASKFYVMIFRVSIKFGDNSVLGKFGMCVTGII